MLRSGCSGLSLSFIDILAGYPWNGIPTDSDGSVAHPSFSNALSANPSTCEKQLIGRVAKSFRVQYVRSARTEPVRPCIGRTKTKQPRAWHPALASRCVLSEYWAQAGGNPVFPRPLTGSPYGGRVMRVRVSGRRRIASNSRIRSRRGSGGLRPVSSHADLVGTRRTRDPRLSENEHAAG